MAGCCVTGRPWTTHVVELLWRTQLGHALPYGTTIGALAAQHTPVALPHAPLGCHASEAPPCDFTATSRVACPDAMILKDKINASSMAYQCVKSTMSSERCSGLLSDHLESAQHEAQGVIRPRSGIWTGQAAAQVFSVALILTGATNMGSALCKPLSPVIPINDRRQLWYIQVCAWDLSHRYARCHFILTPGDTITVGEEGRCMPLCKQMLDG